MPKLLLSGFFFFVLSIFQVNAVYCGEIKQTLPFLKDIQQLNCQSRTGLGNVKAGEVSTEARIPFLSRARESSLFLVWEYGDGKINGLCFKDKLILERLDLRETITSQLTYTAEVNRKMLTSAV